MKKPYLLIVGLVAIVIGIVGLSLLQIYPLKDGNSYSQTYRKNYSSIGEQIYFTAIGEKGPITFQGGPYWLRMRGGSCAACHGPEGKGKIPIMMSNEEAPAITYKSLTEEEEHPPFNETRIKRAITEGIDPAGKPLDITMPRWQMSEEDLNEIIDFLKKLD